MANEMLVIVETDAMRKAAEEALAEFPDESVQVVTRAAVIGWLEGMIKPIKESVDALLARSGEVEHDQPKVESIPDPDYDAIGRAARKRWRQNGHGDPHSMR